MVRAGPGTPAKLLVAVAATIAAVQFGAAHFGAQSPWKGGGFGMYTEPHPQNRKVWLVLETEQGEHRLPVWPLGDRLIADHAAIADPAAAAALRDAAATAYEVATSADTARAAALADLVRGLDWRLAPDGTASLGDGVELKVTGARIAMHELRYDIADRRITARTIDVAGR